MGSSRAFTVTAQWDAEARVWISRSDIKGLVIEADDLDAFEDLVLALAPELIRDNHLAPAGLSNTPISEFMPTVIWKRPVDEAA